MNEINKHPIPHGVIILVRPDAKGLLPHASWFINSFNNSECLFLWLFNVLTWLHYITLALPTCFQIGWIRRGILMWDLEAGREAAVILSLTHLVVYLLAHLIGVKHWPGPYLPSLPLSPPLASLTPGQRWVFTLMMTGTFVWLVSPVNSVSSGALYSRLQNTQFWHIWHCMLSTLLYPVFPL